MSAPLRLLVIDDEENVLRWIRRSLERTGNAVVETARGGLEGLAAVLRGDYDVLVTDLNMPHVTGAELLALAASIAPGAHRILLTGSIEPLDDVPADLVVRKPDFTRLKRAIGELAARRRAA